jgi:predicted nucleic acid-binding Zn ribbon protein
MDGREPPRVAGVRMLSVARRKRDIPSLKDLLPQLLSRLAREGDARTLHPLWADIVGEQAARYSKPESLREGILEVRVTTASWKDALSRQATDILPRLQARLGNGSVKKLVFLWQ